MARKSNAKTGPEGSRQFVMTIFVHETQQGIVYVEEVGGTNVGQQRLPTGIFGIREGLRIGGNYVRGYYLDNQRELDLRDRAADLKRKREEIANAKLEEKKAAIAAPKKKEAGNEA